MLQAQNLSKNYGSLSVLKDVSLKIEKGDFIAIVGPSGAGKSTLLHLLGGLERPDMGKVLFNQEDIFKLSPKKQFSFRNKNMGFVFQFHHLLPEFTAAENVALPLWIAGEEKNDALKKAQEALETVGLKDRVTHKPTELSGGEQQRVAIARSIVNKPSIIFADEPTGNLDTDNAQAVHQLFLKLRDQYQLTFVIVTHNQDLAELADKKWLMKDGELVL